ncbi:Hypothetical_protein [Hexamita inflata]|uniref:Hypothetical_protein n=1 Tax=Hexamita inflata TaxID=28002 RepID=A0AA86R7T0_9EUKA|nr:Hypothetical protein HINF_LOCUS55254 [Hexamita inflata]
MNRTMFLSQQKQQITQQFCFSDELIQNILKYSISYDETLLNLIKKQKFDLQKSRIIFSNTFQLLQQLYGQGASRKYNFKLILEALAQIMANWPEMKYDTVFAEFSDYLRLNISKINLELLQQVLSLLSLHLQSNEFNHQVECLFTDYLSTDSIECPVNLELSGFLRYFNSQQFKLNPDTSDYLFQRWQRGAVHFQEQIQLFQYFKSSDISCWGGIFCFSNQDVFFMLLDKLVRNICIEFVHEHLNQFEDSIQQFIQYPVDINLVLEFSNKYKSVLSSGLRSRISKTALKYPLEYISAFLDFETIENLEIVVQKLQNETIEVEIQDQILVELEKFNLFL